MIERKKDRKTICIVDDDKIYQFATSKLLKMHQPDVEVICFDHGKAAIDYLKKNLSDNSKLPEVILLDINMPVLDAWGFLDMYSEFMNDISKPMDIYIVSSSIDSRDILKASEFKEVKTYLIKPLQEENYKTILG